MYVSHFQLSICISISYRSYLSQCLAVRCEVLIKRILCSTTILLTIILTFILEPPSFLSADPSSKPEGPPLKQGDKVLLNIRAYLAGRQGWVYLDTFKSKDGESIRFTVGEDSAIPGLEIGLLGDGEKTGISPMKKGMKRRLLIPSKLGYTDKNQMPLPKDNGAKRRLFSTVLNKERSRRETTALGDSVVGKLILDVQLIKIQK